MAGSRSRGIRARSLAPAFPPRSNYAKRTEKSALGSSNETIAYTDASTFVHNLKAFTINEQIWFLNKAKPVFIIRACSQLVNTPKA